MPTRGRMSDEKTRDELIDFAKKHLLYEVFMLNNLCKELQRTELPGHIRSALLEAWVIHARVLYEFFYNDNPRRDDVCAADYFPGWRETCHEPFSCWPTSDAHKRLAHLSWRREGESFDWNFLEITRRMDDIIDLFVAGVPEIKDDMREVRPLLSFQRKS